MQFCRPPQKIVCSNVAYLLHKIGGHSGFIYICLYFTVWRSLPEVSFGTFSFLDEVPEIGPRSSEILNLLTEGTLVRNKTSKIQ